jgi:hypothetical protein
MDHLLSKNPTEEYAVACFYLMKEVGVSLDEVKKMEVNSFNALCELFEKDIKLQKREMRKQKKSFS